MIWKSRFQRAVDRWEQARPSDKFGSFRKWHDHRISRAGEAKAVCRALSRATLRNPPASNLGERDVHSLVGFVQAVDGEVAMAVFEEQALPQLRRLLVEGAAQPAQREDDVLFIAKVLALFKQREDAERVARLAASGYGADHFLWSVLLSVFGSGHEHAEVVVDTLRDPLPEGFLGVAFLDQANQLAIAGKLARHPYDCPDGLRRLRAWLSDSQPEHHSYAHSATAALPFLMSAERDTLFELAAEHVDPRVRMEAAWASARSGDDSGIIWLADWAKDPLHSNTAVHYLEELGRADAIPPEATSSAFRAVAEMAEWLADPQEYGRPPDAIELMDQRRLFWPPTRDERDVALVRYTYNPTGDETEPDVGIGMVGSVTFALFGEATPNLSATELYGLHCAWELEGNDDKRAPAERTPAAGLAILRGYNPAL
ncbi:HEAT repeat domain-containing protein [Actomonas aquatica]|uniref:HEAT repeat domain-containing protein n=1 Tax=Actomonas aquatica TaxID=2866162 RepID=A0ABZ1C2V9_9BACT|nr:HEAT repeat domain-containing protein [Opitutus sp. WL0086]WRQ86039.1 HEAT repeat domain-containing protein [Opitutus sp. WL0086]